eukprot:7377870-Prymnesium_polylepis.1
MKPPRTTPDWRSTSEDDLDFVFRYHYSITQHGAADDSDGPGGVSSVFNLPPSTSRCTDSGTEGFRRSMIKWTTMLKWASDSAVMTMMSEAVYDPELCSWPKRKAIGILNANEIASCRRIASTQSNSARPPRCAGSTARRNTLARARTSPVGHPRAPAQHGAHNQSRIGAGAGTGAGAHLQAHERRAVYGAAKAVGEEADGDRPRVVNRGADEHDDDVERRKVARAVEVERQEHRGGGDPLRSRAARGAPRAGVTC